MAFQLEIAQVDAKKPNSSVIGANDMGSSDAASQDTKILKLEAIDLSVLVFKQGSATHSSSGPNRAGVDDYF